MRPRRRQPTRVRRPWDSPGKNTGVGFHFLLQCMKVKSESEATQSCPTQRPHGLQPTRLLHPWDFPGKTTGVGCSVPGLYTPSISWWLPTVRMCPILTSSDLQAPHLTASWTLRMPRAQGELLIHFQILSPWTCLSTSHLDTIILPICKVSEMGYYPGFLLIVLLCSSTFVVVQLLCPTVCNCMDCSTPGFPVLHYLLEFESVMLSNHLILCHPFSSCSQSFPASGSFPVRWLLASGGQSTGASASAPVLPVNFQGWFPLGMIGLLSLLSKELFESSPAPQYESINFSVLSLLYGPTHTSVHDYWKKHHFNYMNLCQPSDVCAF